MSTATADPEVAATIAAIHTHDGHFPRQAVEDILALGDRIRPALIKIVKKTVALDHMPLAEWQEFTIAVHVLSSWRATEIFRNLIAICHKPEHFVDATFGRDGMSEDLPRYLASTFSRSDAATAAANTDALRALALNPSVDQFARSAAIRTHAILHRQGTIARDAIIAYYRDLFEALKGDHTYAHTSLICCCEDIRATELLDEIRDAYARGEIDKTVIRLDYIEEEFAKGGGKHHPFNKGYVDDPVKEMQGWACWKENRPFAGDSSASCPVGS